MRDHQPPIISIRRRPLALLATVGTLVLMVAGCQAQSVQAPAVAASQAPDALARIQAHIGKAPCDTNAQCRTLPIGHRACGGPESWLAWSTVNGQADQLQRWSAELAAQQKQDQQRRGLMSTCQIQPDPGAVCVKKQCVLGTARLAE